MSDEFMQVVGDLTIEEPYVCPLVSWLLSPLSSAMIRCLWDMAKWLSHVSSGLLSRPGRCYCEKSGLISSEISPDIKVHGANMGPIWVLLAPCWPHGLCYLGQLLDKYDHQIVFQLMWELPSWWSGHEITVGWTWKRHLSIVSMA